MTMTDFDPFSAAALADPYPDFARFVERQPVFWSDQIGSWVVSRHGDAKQVLRRYDDVLGGQRARLRSPRRARPPVASWPTAGSARSRR